MLAFQVLVESVLDLRDGSPLELRHLGDVRPSGPQLVVHLEKKLIFFGSPLLSVDVWVEHIDPSFAALSTDSIREVVGDADPLPGSVLLDLLPEYLIFLLRPKGVVRVHHLWFCARGD